MEKEKRIVVGIFVPNATTSIPASVYPIRRAVQCKGWDCMDLSTQDLEHSMLHSKSVSVLVLPGGEPREMKYALILEACRSVERWKRQSENVGLVGICAGAVVAVQKSLVKGIRLVDDNRFASAGLSSMVEVKLRPSLLAPVLLDSMNAHFTSINVGKNDGSLSLEMPYVSGPLFALKNCSSNKKNTECSPHSSSVAIWGLYQSDAVTETKQQYTSVINVAGQTKSSSQGKCAKGASWSCSIWTKVYSSSNRSCCGLKRREHDKQCKMLKQLVGVMPGKGAVSAVCAKESLFRSVLFGPHPEMGNQACVDFLTASIAWASGVK